MLNANPYLLEKSFNILNAWIWVRLTCAADAVALRAGAVVDAVPRLALGRRVARPVFRCRGDARVVREPAVGKRYVVK